MNDVQTNQQRAPQYVFSVPVEGKLNPVQSDSCFGSPVFWSKPGLRYSLEGDGGVYAYGHRVAGARIPVRPASLLNYPGHILFIKDVFGP